MHTVSETTQHKEYSSELLVNVNSCERKLILYLYIGSVIWHYNCVTFYM